MPQGTFRVLYVDDDPGLARLVRRTLEAAGFACEHAVDGDAAMARLEAGGIDVVALDHHMPGRTGIDLMPSIRALPHSPPIIYVTGSEDSRVAVAALKAGAVDYVWKDVQGHFRELLAEAVSQALERKALASAKEEAEAELRISRDRALALAEERELLLKEMNHRVGNSLQIIASLLQLQARGSQSTEVKEALDEARHRVIAVAQVHRRLYTSSDVQVVSLDQYLRSVIEELRKSSQATGDIGIDFVSDPVETAPDEAISLGIIVNELVTNALKYAYPGTQGPVRVTLASHADVHTLRVADEGQGFDPQGTTASGLGSRIIRIMAEKLAARLDVKSSSKGTAVTLEWQGRAAPVAA